MRLREVLMDWGFELVLDVSSIDASKWFDKGGPDDYLPAVKDTTQYVYVRGKHPKIMEPDAG
jgi:hypothetical protein